MALSRDPPFFAGTILGVRSWNVVVRLPSSDTRLEAAVADAAWEPRGRWTIAACDREMASGRGAHEAPQTRCSCGLYALHPRLEELVGLLDANLAGNYLRKRPGVDIGSGVFGVVEAAGRIELHDSGFRAARARPVALIGSRRWNDRDRAAIAELAELYSAEVLLVEEPAEVLEWCERRGGVLTDEQVSELIDEVACEEWVASPAPAHGAVPASAPIRRPARPRPVAPPKLSDRLLRAAELVGQGLMMLVLGLFSLFLYGGIALGVVVAAGGILFGWFGWDEEPGPIPARIETVTLDRQRCLVEATVQTDRRVKELRVRLAGRDHRGKGLGHLQKSVGEVPKGRSRVRVVKLSKLCGAPHEFSARVRVVSQGRLGRPVSTSAGPGEVATGKAKRKPARQEAVAGTTHLP